MYNILCLALWRQQEGQEGPLPPGHFQVVGRDAVHTHNWNT